MNVLAHPCRGHHIPTQKGKTGGHDPVNQNFSPVLSSHPSYEVQLKRCKFPCLSHLSSLKGMNHYIQSHFYDFMIK